MRMERSASCSSVIPTRTIPTHNLSATQYAHMAFQLHRRKAISACRKSFFSPHGAGIHRWPSRFPCALRPKAGSLPRNGLAFSATGGASPVSPSWVIYAPRAAFGGCAPKRACGRSPAHTLYPQGVCRIRKAAEPLTAALPFHRGEFTTLLTISAAARKGRRCFCIVCIRRAAGV